MDFSWPESVQPQAPAVSSQSSDSNTSRAESVIEEGALVDDAVSVVTDKSNRVPSRTNSDESDGPTDDEQSEVESVSSYDEEDFDGLESLHESMPPPPVNEIGSSSTTARSEKRK